MQRLLQSDIFKYIVVPMIEEMCIHKKKKDLKNKLMDYDFYLGKAYANNDKYLDAITQFELYKKNPLPDTVSALVNRQIQICQNALGQQTKTSIATIINIGAPVNTTASEYSPLLPGNESFMVFAYRGIKSKGGKQKYPGKPDDKGSYFEDVFIAQKKRFSYLE